MAEPNASTVAEPDASTVAESNALTVAESNADKRSQTPFGESTMIVRYSDFALSRAASSSP